MRKRHKRVCLMYNRLTSGNVLRLSIQNYAICAKPVFPLLA